MRAGCGTLQQALTADAAGIVKNAVALARRRGHAQVTPLHVASSMLSSTTMLRDACLRSHSHPLQCKALDLCFNVALNRLPTSASVFGHHHHATAHHVPTLSNALVAAFKRAQAHQRRGCTAASSVDSQPPQPLLAIKIELAQLIISILDDPSVSRVMREAGVSSTQVKGNVEKFVSLEVTTTPTSSSQLPNPSAMPTDQTATGHLTTTTSKNVRNFMDRVKAEDVKAVLELMAGSVGRQKRTSVILLAECLADVEGVVRVVMDRVSKGVDVPETLKNVQFIPFSLASFRLATKEDVEHRVGELRCLVRNSHAAGKGVVVFIEDVKWNGELWACSMEVSRGNIKGLPGARYCPVEHAAKEVAGLFSAGGHASNRLWVLGFATYEGYARCRVGHPSLEALWGLMTMNIPDHGSSGPGLNLGLRTEMEHTAVANQFADSRRLLHDASCSAPPSIMSCLTSWPSLHYRGDRVAATRDNQQGSLQLQDLCKQWNSECDLARRNLRSQPPHSCELMLNLSSSSPSSSSKSAAAGNLHQPCESSWQLLQLAADQHHQSKHSPQDRRRWLVLDHQDQQESSWRQTETVKDGGNSTSSDGGTNAIEYRPRFKEMNAENLKTLCDEMERSVTRHKHVVPEIASEVLQCRSEMRRKKAAATVMRRTAETWLLLHGNDVDSKVTVARVLAGLVFGSCAELTRIELGSSSSPAADGGRRTGKRGRTVSASGGHLGQELYRAVRENPHRVILLEDVDDLDYDSLLALKNSIDAGVLKGEDCDDEVAIDDAIIILSCETLDSPLHAPSTKRRAVITTAEEITTEADVDAASPDRDFDLNVSAENDSGDEGPPASSVGDLLLGAVDGAFFLGAA